MAEMQRRRRCLTTASYAGVAGLVGAPRSLHAEPPPETTTIRLPRWIGGAYCWAAEYIAEDLVHAGDFSDVRYLRVVPNADQSVWIARGETDFSINHPPIHIISIGAAWTPVWMLIILITKPERAKTCFV